MSDATDRERSEQAVGHPRLVSATDIPQQPQRQDCLDEQMKDLLTAAIRLGLYDASDFIKDRYFRR